MDECARADASRTIMGQWGVRLTSQVCSMESVPAEDSVKSPWLPWFRTSLSRAQLTSGVTWKSLTNVWKGTVSPTAVCLFHNICCFTGGNICCFTGGNICCFAGGNICCFMGGNICCFMGGNSFRFHVIELETFVQCSTN